MDGLAAVGLISEFLTWIGLVTGIPLYIAGVSVRAVGRSWRATDGIVADGPGGPDAPRAAAARVLRWFDDDGEVHERPADTAESLDLSPGDDVQVWFSPRAPWKARTHAPELDGRALRVTGLALIAVGVVGALAGLALLFL